MQLCEGLSASAVTVYCVTSVIKQARSVSVLSCTSVLLSSVKVIEILQVIANIQWVVWYLKSFQKN